MKTMNRCLLPLALALSTVACSSTSQGGMTAPTPALERRDLTYAINVPDRFALQSLIAAHPDGVHISPVEAQKQYDFSAGYGGSPNVYAGEVSPDKNPPAPWQTYNLTGIVIAPYAVANVEVFPASAWPNEYGQFAAGVEYAWVGRFAYSVPWVKP